MRQMAVVALAAAIGLLVSGSGQPSSAQQPDEVDAAQALISSIEQALGGAKAIAGVTSLKVTAACTGPGGEFKTEVSSLRPGWVWFRQTSADGVTEVWSGPERTWGVGENGEVQDYSAGVRSFVRAHEFHVVIMELATRFTDHRVGPTRTIRGQLCTALLMKEDMGLNATLYVSNETHLPVMLETNPEGAAGAVRIYYERWEAKAGVLFFHGFELTEGDDRTFRYDYDSIEPNAVSAEQFDEPSPDSR